MRSRLTLLAVLAALAVAGVVWLPHDIGALTAVVTGAGIWAPVVLFGVWIAGTALMVPGTLLCAVGGLLLGPLGIAVSLVGSPLGALFAFGIVRLLRTDALERRMPRRVRAAAIRLETGGVRAVALLRMAPGLPVCLFNYACGLTRVRARDFVLGSALGAAPRLVLYGALGGAALRSPAITLACGAAVALAVAGSLLLHRRARLAV